jgi:hypothetical protein
LASSPTGHAPRALAVALAVIAAGGIAHAQAPRQPAAGAPAQRAPDLDQPVTEPRGVTVLRGGIAGGQPAARTIIPVAPTEPSFVQRAPTAAQSRTRRQTQGAVVGNVRRPVTGAVRAPVYDGRASTLGVVPPPAPPPPRRRPPEADPFAPTGLRLGTFILRPAVEAGIGFTDNVNATAGARTGSAFSRLATEARLDSDWSRHAIGLRGRIERQDFRSNAAEPRTTIDTAATLRLDATRTSRIDAQANYRRAPDSTSGLVLPAAALNRPDVEQIGGQAGITQRFARLEVSLRGTYDQFRFGSTDLADGTRLSNRSRDANLRTLNLRAGYDLTPALQPFVEALYAERRFLVDIDPVTGRPQGSDLLIPRAGFAFDMGTMLRGEFAVGWATQRPRDDTLARTSGLTLDGNVAWAVTPLTTVRVIARSNILDTAASGGAGGLTREGIVQVDHALLRNLTLSGSGGIAIDDFAGVTRTDRRLTATLAAVWRLNRNAALRVAATHQRQTSNVPGNDVRVNTVEGGIRFEY